MLRSLARATLLYLILLAGLTACGVNLVTGKQRSSSSPNPRSCRIGASQCADQAGRRRRPTSDMPERADRGTSAKSGRSAAVSDCKAALHEFTVLNSSGAHAWALPARSRSTAAC